MTHIQKAALIQWRILVEQPVSQDELAFCLKMAIGDHQGSPLHGLTPTDMSKLTHAIIQQALKSDLAKNWHPAFNNEHQNIITHDDAQAFLLAFHNCVQESIGLFFSSNISAGTTHKQQGTPSDVNTRRINGKLGWRLHLTIKGSGTYNCISQQLITQPGDLILLSPDALMDYRREPSTPSWQHHWVYFPQQENWIQLLNWPHVAKGIHRLRLSSDNSHQIETLFTQIIHHNNHHDYLSGELSKNLLEQVLLHCKRMTPSNQYPASDNRVDQAKDYIVEHFDKAFTVDDIATHVGLSTARLTSLFKRQIHTSIMKYRDQHRMAKAAQLLLQSNMAIKQIAEKVGYNDALYFSRTFSQALGCSPKEYRDSPITPDKA